MGKYQGGISEAEKGTTPEWFQDDSERLVSSDEKFACARLRKEELGGGARVCQKR